MKPGPNQPRDISIKRVHIKQTKTFEQLGILVLDGSGSMEEQTAQHVTKADAVTRAVNDFFSRFKASSICNNFSFAIVNYDHRSVVKMQPTQVKKIDDHGDYNPMDGLGGATYISEGLAHFETVYVLVTEISCSPRDGSFRVWGYFFFFFF